MPSNVNVTISNFNIGTGPTNASVDLSATWIADDGTVKSASRTGVTLAQLWARPAITAAVKQDILQDVIWKLVRIDAGIDAVT